MNSLLPEEIEGRKFIFYCQGGKTLEQITQRGYRVSNPGVI